MVAGDHDSPARRIASPFTGPNRAWKERTTNEDGKAKVKYKRQEPGAHTLNVCDLESGC